MKEKYTNQTTETLLNEALDRLLNGNPINTKKDGKININRINNEANLTSGLIYHYKSFLITARLKIENHNKSIIINKLQNEIKSLRSEIKNSKNISHKKQENEKKFYNEILAQNISLAHQLIELESKILTK